MRRAWILPAAAAVVLPGCAAEGLFSSPQGWGLVLLGIIAFCYIGGPLLVHMSLRQPARPAFEVLDETRLRQLPEPVRDFFQQTTGELAGAGFTPAAYLFHQDPNTAGATAVLALLENRAARDAAIAVAMYVSTSGSPKLKQTYVEFATEFAGGGEISTGNSPELHVMAELPEKRVLRFPEIREAARLFEIHRRLVVRDAAGRAKTFRAKGEGPAEFMRRNMQQDLAAQAEAGYFYLAEAAGVYRPTWKGAFLMAWKLLWPVSAILRMRRRRRNVELQRELGL